MKFLCYKTKIGLVRIVRASSIVTQSEFRKEEHTSRILKAIHKLLHTRLFSQNIFEQQTANNFVFFGIHFFFKKQNDPYISSGLVIDSMLITAFLYREMDLYSLVGKEKQHDFKSVHIECRMVLFYTIGQGRFFDFRRFSFNKVQTVEYIHLVPIFLD